MLSIIYQEKLVCTPNQFGVQPHKDEVHSIFKGGEVSTRANVQKK